MTFTSENIIPGNYGKKFATDVDDPAEQSRLEAAIMQVEGVTKVVFEDTFPLEFTVHTDRVVNISEIQEKANELNFHVIAKGPYYPLM